MFKDKSYEDEIMESMESIQKDLFSIPKYAAAEDEFKEPTIPEIFPKSEAVMILAKNDWQLPLKQLTDLLGWGSTLDIEEIEKQLGIYFTTSGDISNLWVVLSDYGKDILNQGGFDKGKFDEEKAGIEGRESLEVFEDESDADDWEDES